MESDWPSSCSHFSPLWTHVVAPGACKQRLYRLIRRVTRVLHAVLWTAWSAPAVRSQFRCLVVHFNPYQSRLLSISSFIYFVFYLFRLLSNSNFIQSIFYLIYLLSNSSFVRQFSMCFVRKIRSGWRSVCVFIMGTSHIIIIGNSRVSTRETHGHRRSWTELFVQSLWEILARTFCTGAGVAVTWTLETLFCCQVRNRARRSVVCRRLMLKTWLSRTFTSVCRCCSVIFIKTAGKWHCIWCLFLVFGLLVGNIRECRLSFAMQWAGGRRQRR